MFMQPTTRDKVLSLLQEGRLRQKDIAAQLGVSEARISAIKRGVKLPVKLGVKLPVNLTGKMTSISHIPPTKLNSELKNKLTNRLHRYYMKTDILNAISEERLKSLKINKDLKNNVVQWLGVGFRITHGTLKNSLELEGLEIISDYRLPIALLRAQAHQLASNILNELSVQYGLNLSKYVEIEKLTEIELNATQMTDKLKQLQKNGIIELYKDQNGYSIWADWSLGVGGLESNSPQYMQRISDLAKDLAEKDGWQQTKSLLLDITQAQLKTQQQVEQLAIQLNIHAPYLNAWQTIAQAINNPKKRNKVLHEINNLKQRKL